MILDHDATNVDVLRKFGFEVYYGDVTRLDLLEAAGLASSYAGEHAAARVLLEEAAALTELDEGDLSAALQINTTPAAIVPHLNGGTLSAERVRVFDLEVGFGRGIEARRARPAVRIAHRARRDRLESFEEIGGAGIFYIAAWQSQEKEIWYEYVSRRLTDMLGCRPEEAAAVFRDSVLDRREYRVEAVADRVAILNRGRLIRIGTVDELTVQESQYEIEADIGNEQININTATAQELFNSCSAHGGAAWDHSAMVKALELLAKHEVA